MNAYEVGNHQGLIGMGLRELQNDEIMKYCPNTKPFNPPLMQSNPNSSFSLFSTDFYFFVYTSGCYYIDHSTSKWSSYLVEVVNDTSISFIHCKTNHLTTFSGGIDILPSVINFDYFYDKTSTFIQNKTIYLTIIITFALYIIFCIWGIWKDRQDFLKIGVAPLIDNQSNDDYFYEILVFTGNRKHAETDSKVRCFELNQLFYRNFLVLSLPSLKYFYLFRSIIKICAHFIKTNKF